MITIGWLHYRTRPFTRPLSIYRLPLELFAAVLVAITAHLGGILSGVNVPV
jgi:hypothetical protein